MPISDSDACFVAGSGHGSSICSVWMLHAAPSPPAQAELTSVTLPTPRFMMVMLRRRPISSAAS